MHYKYLILSAFILFLQPVFAIKSSHGLDGFIEGKIDATKNARLHSNMGNIYFSEKKYISAFKEYEIAFNLAHNTQAGGVYLYNIAKCYMAINDWDSAKKFLDGAIKKDCINITYYTALSECIYNLGTSHQELENYLNDTTNPYNKIMAGLIYIRLNKKTKARSIFDDFIVSYPDMIITQDIKVLLKQL